MLFKAQVTIVENAYLLLMVTFVAQAWAITQTISCYNKRERLDLNSNLGMKSEMTLRDSNLIVRRVPMYSLSLAFTYSKHPAISDLYRTYFANTFYLLYNRMMCKDFWCKIKTYYSEMAEIYLLLNPSSLSPLPHPHSLSHFC